MMEPGRVTSDAELAAVEYVFDSADEGGLEVQLQGRLGAERVASVDHPGCDVIVLQRPAHKHLVEAIPHLQAHGVAVVCDYDDDFDTIDMANPAYAAYDPATNPMSNKVWAKLASELADLVTVATPALAKKYGAHGRCVVLPNCVPERYLKVTPFWPVGAERRCEYTRIGWAGNPRTHPGDLEVMDKAIFNLVDNNRAVFRTIGTKKTLDILGHGITSSFEFLNEYVEWVSIDEYPSLVASFDIGVVPLRDSTFNKSKSWLKGLEYAALGVPFVASPTKPYSSLSYLGAGDLVTTTTRNTMAWERALGRFLDDGDYRDRRAEEGRAVAKVWTFENNAEKWAQAWKDAQTIRRSR